MRHYYQNQPRNDLPDRIQELERQLGEMTKQRDALLKVLADLLPEDGWHWTTLHDETKRPDANWLAPILVCRTSSG